MVAVAPERLGPSSVGFMDDFYYKGELILAFRYCGHHVQMRASAAGWAELNLRENRGARSGATRRRAGGAGDEAGDDRRSTASCGIG